MNKHTWVLIAMLAGLICAGLLYRYLAQEVDSRGATRLMRALEENDTQRARKLLEEGTDITAQDKSGQTALFYVARHADDPALLHKLLLAGANPLAQDKHGYTPLMRAAESNPAAIITKVLSKQGGLSAQQIENRNQALLLAARHNQAAVIKALLGAHANSSFAGVDGKTAADLLADNEHLSTAEKNDFRQTMLVLEILEAREQFKQSFTPRATAKSGTTAAKPASSNAARIPQEKQMAAEVESSPVNN